MKLKYTEPELDIVLISDSDVIRTSGESSDVDAYTEDIYDDVWWNGR